MRQPTPITPQSSAPAGRAEVQFPAPATYSFAGRSEPVVVLGLAPDCELRIVDANGNFKTVGEHRVRLLRRPA